LCRCSCCCTDLWNLCKRTVCGTLVRKPGGSAWPCLLLAIRQLPTRASISKLNIALVVVVVVVAFIAAP
jgi:hypothetical protein